MKKISLVIAGVAVLGVTYWLVSPLFITRTVNEEVPMENPDAGENASQEGISEVQQEIPVSVVSQGTFMGKAGHSASGTARIIETDGKKYVRFESDFKVTNGPDLFVHFGKDGEYSASAQLGALKGNEGSQNYEITSDIDPADFDEVWVWCRAFSVPFGVAELE
ncbi:MAG: hypothetical protein UY41_C0011G0030 [Candidatus Moranbacteria bacterium GW2011_GWE1_49_15]|nr:MAG: hypothetical protein UX75_C0019G0004 [Candidatus Moranbacteria bacterium GW2011_GWE2_47_10]KKW06973.1 MAG: hypothetical protein UY41_C0011G0030 [Candidatus Moranbacteria bacterium GW2011_GWE1_49_15]HBP01383.1 electron transporter [Candidatus Moranbacteria bacterium]